MKKTAGSDGIELGLLKNITGCQRCGQMTETVSKRGVS